MSFPNQRPRRLRASSTIRDLVAEQSLSVNDLIAPIFITEGQSVKESIPSMPDYFRFSLDMALLEIQELTQLGIKAVLLFVKVSDELKNAKATEALNENGLMQKAIRSIKQHFPTLYLMTDVALDPFSSDGHDGIVVNGEIVNDQTTEILAKMAVSHAKAGADCIAPSDMMDGRVMAIRLALEESGLSNTAIMSYTAKYASCFYGPFRDALDSAPGFGDKKTYQMDFSNREEAVREALLDVEEGADILMVKPANVYLDVIQAIKERTKYPVAAYHVSGEYAMIKAAAEKGWINEEEAMIEVTTSIKRAGADLIATYFAKQLAEKLKK